MHSENPKMLKGPQTFIHVITNKIVIAGLHCSINFKVSFNAHVQ